MSRTFFVLPEVPSPTGGPNIAISFAKILKQNGVDVSLLYSSPDYFYPFLDHTTIPTAYVPTRPPRSLKRRVWDLFQPAEPKNPAIRKQGANTLVSVTAEDVLVLPEYDYAIRRHFFPQGRHVLFCQGYAPLFYDALALGPDRRAIYADLTATIATSELCADAVRAFTGLEPAVVPLSLSRDRYQFQQKKKKQIAYMPRRRGQELGGLVTLLGAEPALKGYAFVAIDQMSAPQVDAVLAESLIFLSGSQGDGFGLPPAEAMAMGCIAIGYTGNGGAEYLTPDVGFPVPEDNTVAFYSTVLRVIEEYETDAVRLDAMRKRASEAILGRYTVDETTKQLLNFWKTLEL